MKKKYRKTCPKCKCYLKDGKALTDIYGGYNDFDSVITMSPTGQAKLIDVTKCPKCGYSQGK